MQRFRQLLVGLACQPADDELIRYTAEVVRLGTARSVQFLHVLERLTDQARRAAQEQIGQRVGEHFTASATVEVRCEVVEGAREDQLLAEALHRKSDLLLVGHGRGRAGRKSLARRLAMKAPCSVWMVPQGAAPTLRRVLVPVDFSAPSADALAVAAELVRLQRAGELFTLHVYFNELVASFEEYAATLRHHEEDLLRAFDDKVDNLQVPLQPLVEQSVSPAQAILRVAAQRDMDLVVMSTRGRSCSAAVLLGSVTEDVIVQTHLPLLAVKHFGTKLGLLQALLRASEREPGPHYN